MNNHLDPRTTLAATFLAARIGAQLDSDRPATDAEIRHSIQDADRFLFALGIGPSPRSSPIPLESLPDWARQLRSEEATP